MSHTIPSKVQVGEHSVDTQNIMKKVPLQNAKNKNKSGFENPCKVCSPLGASLCMKGIQGSMTILHGSQGCSTYIRRYLIGHFREPIDIASSNFHEDTAIFGGAANLHKALLNVRDQYQPTVLAVATTCLAETVGEDVPGILFQFRKEHGEDFPPVIHISTPSYQGTHRVGFHKTVLSLVQQTNPVSEEGEERSSSKGVQSTNKIPVFAGMVSPADLRWTRDFIEDWGLEPVIIPDYNKTLDGGIWDEFQLIPEGGTPIEDIKEAHKAPYSLEWGRVLEHEETAGKWLESAHSVKRVACGAPMGVLETDALVAQLETLTGRTLPRRHAEDRARLLDAYVDAHKYTAGKRAMIYGDEDFVLGMTAFLRETGVSVILCGTGGRTGNMKKSLAGLLSPREMEQITIMGDSDFDDMEDVARQNGINLLVGNSKGFKLSKKLQVPLLRAGFPVHDRFGAARLLQFGYQGAQQMLDRLINLLITDKQNANPVGYTYQ